MEAFPKIAQDLLKSNGTCFLATSENDSPHVALMNFTYLEQEKAIVMTTRTNTLKFKYIQSNPKAAVLIHNTGDHSGNNTSNDAVSVTFHGEINVVSSEEEKERYRQLHLANRPKSKQFIQGELVTVLLFKIRRTIVCDMTDATKTFDE